MTEGVAVDPMLTKLTARQLARPSAFIGKFLLGPIWNRRNAVLNETTLSAMQPQAADRILEVGFGGGYLLNRLASVVTCGLLAGVDISPGMASYSSQRNRLLVRQGRLLLGCAQAEALPFPRASFTKACCVNSIFYWEDVVLGFSELRRVLQDGGCLVVCFTDRRSLEGRRFARHGLSLYACEEVQRLLKAAGLRPQRAVEAADRHRKFWCVTAVK